MSAGGKSTHMVCVTHCNWIRIQYCGNRSLLPNAPSGKARCAGFSLLSQLYSANYEPGEPEEPWMLDSGVPDQRCNEILLAVSSPKGTIGSAWISIDPDQQNINHINSAVLAFAIPETAWAKAFAKGKALCHSEGKRKFQLEIISKVLFSVWNLFPTYYIVTLRLWKSQNGDVLDSSLSCQ